MMRKRSVDAMSERPNADSELPEQTAASHGEPGAIHSVLRALVELYNKERLPVKSRDVASVLGMHEGYVRNVLSVLKSMGLVISRAGPHGGYVPTLRALDLLSKQVSSVPITYLGNVIGYALDVTLVGLLSERPYASMRAVGDLSGYVNRKVRIGPLPSGLVLIGRVIRADAETLLEITSTVSVPKALVRELMTPNPVTARPDDPVSLHIKVFIEKRYRGIPVVDEQMRPVGILLASKVLERVMSCRPDARVRDVMVADPPTIREDESIYEAIRAMFRRRLGRLLVVNSEGELTGILTRTDILNRIATLDELA
jgi:predicted transcriptional regulator